MRSGRSFPGQVLAILVLGGTAAGVHAAELTGAIRANLPFAVVEAPPAPGDSKLAEARSILLNLDDSPEHLNQVLADCEQAIALGLSAPRKAEAQAWKALVYMRFGDHAKDTDQKLQFYDKGRQEAEAGIAADARSALAHFYRGANMGRWGLARGVIHSLFMLKDVRSEFERVRELDPRNLDALLALAKVDQEVPGIFGGSRERAEKLVRTALAEDPHFTRGMLDLAELLDKTGRRGEALTWVKRAQTESAPTRPGEWKNYDRWRAEHLLAEWKPAESK